MSELVFNTAPKTSQVTDVAFTLDDREYVAHGPKKAAWATLVHGTGTAAGGDAFHAVLTFLDACLDPIDQSFLETRLRDQNDDLDLDDLLDVVHALVEEWEPYLGDEFAELTGENRATRRARTRNGSRQPARRTAAKGRAPARRTNTVPAAARTSEAAK